LLPSLRRRVSALARPAPPLRYGIKWGVALCAALWLGHAYALPHAQWIAFTVMFVMQPLSGASALKSLLRIVGTIAAGLYSIWAFGAFAQDPPLLLASIFGGLVIGIYGMTGPRFQYAWNVFAFTTLIVLASALAGHGAVETLAFERGSMVALGIVIVLVVDSIFWPTRVGAELRGSFAQRARLAGDALGPSLDALRSGALPVPSEAPPSPLAQQLQLVTQYRMELGVSSRRAAAAGETAGLLEALERRARDLEARLRAFARPAPSGPLRDALAEVARALEIALGSVVRALDSEAVPAPFEERLERAIEGLEALRLAGLENVLGPDPASASAPRGMAASVEVHVARSRISALLRDVASVLSRLEGSLQVFLGPDPPARNQPPLEIALPRIDGFRVGIAVRSALASCLCLVLMLSFGWAIDTLSMIIAFTIASLPTQPAGKQLGALVLAVGLVTWLLTVLAITFVVPDLGRMPGALVLAFAATVGVGALAVKRPQLAPVAGILLVLCVLPIYGGPSPPTNIEGPYDTTVYIWLGLASGLFALRFFWPKSARSLFWERVADQLELCASLRSTSIRKDAALAAFSTRLTLLAQLDGQCRQELGNTSAYDETRSEIIGLLQTLFDAISCAPALDARVRTESTAALLDALDTASRAVEEGLSRVAGQLRGEISSVSSTLPASWAHVEAAADELRADAAAIRTLAVERLDALLNHLGAQREVARTQIAIEQWQARRAGVSPEETR